MKTDIKAQSDKYEKNYQMAILRENTSQRYVLVPESETAAINEYFDI